MRTGWAALGFLLVVVGIIVMLSEIETFGEFQILGYTLHLSSFGAAVLGLVILALGLALPGPHRLVVVRQRVREIRTVVACPSCGKFVSRKARHCPNCGYRLKR
ncbi:MAG: zinc ribbon domain-containing protein [Candidatus Hadarchaeales archaeon]